MSRRRSQYSNRSQPRSNKSNKQKKPKQNKSYRFIRKNKFNPDLLAHIAYLSFCDQNDSTTTVCSDKTQEELSHIYNDYQLKPN